MFPKNRLLKPKNNLVMLCSYLSLENLLAKKEFKNNPKKVLKKMNSLKLLGRCKIEQD